jgi:competence protein ComEC
LGWTEVLRREFADRAAALPGDGGALLPGLAIGDVNAVSSDLDSAMKASSLSHLTAVSGANCAVVIGIVMTIAAALGLRRPVRVALALVALTGFVMLVTPGPSVLRAAVMAAIVVFSYSVGRPGRGVPALAAAVLVLLVADPWIARSYGFTLSVFATAGLLMLAPPLAARFALIMPRPLAFAIAVPVAAQLACQPIVILLNPAVPLFGIAANLLAEPAAALAAIGGLVSCVLLPWLPGLGGAAAQFAWIPSAWIAAVARVCADLPASQLAWPGGLVGLALIVGLGTAALILVFRRGILRVAAGLVIGLFLASYLGTAVGSDVVRKLSMPSDWQVGACDIGQGDAILLRDGDKHGLIDVGPDPQPLTECLDRLGIARIDLLVLSHYDLDHVGGVEAVVGRVGTALVGPAATQQDRRILERLEQGGAEIHFAAAGDSGKLGRLDWRVLWPQADSRVMQTGNEGSVTLGVDGRGISSVFLGDLDERAQDALLATHAVAAVDVVKVAHHGSADQSESLYRVLAARLGLISVGADNDYGHPTARLLGILAATGTTPARTDIEGMLLVSADASGVLQLWTEREAPNPVKAATVPASLVVVASHGERRRRLRLGFARTEPAKGEPWRRAQREVERRGLRQRK